MISEEAIEQMFANARNAQWDVEGVACWGYYFIDHDGEKLEKASIALESMGYRVVEILGPSPDSDDQELQMLHVERIERHTPKTLLARNTELYAFAETMGLESYDGMDVGPYQEIPGA